MKTRIFYTKFWTDSYILSLSPLERLLYNFYLSNENVGMTGIYQIAPQLVQLSTGLTQQQITKAQQKFITDKKMNFHADWVFIQNFEKYQTYTGEKNQIALEREKSLIPNEILEILHVYTMDGLSAVADSPINHKTEILNKKLNEGVVKGEQKVLQEQDFEEIATAYHVPIAFVKSKWDDVQNYCASSGKKYRDYKATLRNWVKKDAMNLRKEEKNGSARLRIITPDAGWEHPA